MSSAGFLPHMGEQKRQESNMTICMEESAAYLQGDWTFSGITSNGIELLADSLQQLESRCSNYIHIDCGRVRAVDIGGLQLLGVWMQCARIRGVVPVLTNLPTSLQEAMQGVGA
jgi:ABC-type transporter Mla MlaB component